MAIVNHCFILSPSFLQGHIDLTGVGKRGYHIPRKGTVQVVSVTRVMVKIEVCVCVCVEGGCGCGCGCVVTTSCNFVIISPYAMHPHKLLVQPSLSHLPHSLLFSSHPLTFSYHAPPPTLPSHTPFPLSPPTYTPLPCSPLSPPTLHIPPDTLQPKQDRGEDLRSNF